LPSFPTRRSSDLFGLFAGSTRARPIAPRVDGEGARVGRRDPGRPQGAAVPWSDRLCVRGRPSYVDEAGMGTRRRMGRRHIPPSPSGKNDLGGKRHMRAGAFIADAVGTPAGKKKGALARIPPADLGAHVLKALVERA